MASDSRHSNIRSTTPASKARAGFTIIEVLIVLAIAALILLVVFLAVPALQRNSRNAQYNREASRFYAAAQEFMSNNNGTLPAASGSGTAGSDAAKIFALANPKNVSVLTVVASGTVTAQSPTLGATPTDILVSGGVKCGAEGGATLTPTTTGASPKSLALIYAVENSDGSVNAQCTDG